MLLNGYWAPYETLNLKLSQAQVIALSPNNMGFDPEQIREVGVKAHHIYIFVDYMHLYAL